MRIRGPARMRGLGEELAPLLRAGDLVVLSGPLGAGKTVLAQGIATGLGVPGPVTSPTFVLARVHSGGRVPFVHADAYRLGLGADGMLEVDALDLDAEAEESVTVVEWGEGLVEGLTEARLVVAIARGIEDETRLVGLAAYGDRWAGVPLPG